MRYFSFRCHRFLYGWIQTSWYRILYSCLIITLYVVVVGVHFIGDIIVGACIGIAIGWLAWHYRDALDPIIIKPFIVIAKWIKLYYSKY